MVTDGYRNVLLQGDVRARLAEVPPGVVQCCVTSIPYWGLRDYGIPPVVWDCHRGTEAQSGCEHEWGDEEPGDPRGGSGPAAKEAYAGDGKTTYARQVPRGRFCTLCGAWLGSLGLEPTIDLFVAHVVEVFREVGRTMRDDGTLWLNVGDAYASGKGTCHNPGGGEASEIPDSEDKRTCRVFDRKNKTDLYAMGLKPKDLIGQPWRVAFAMQGFAVVPFTRFSDWADMLGEAREKGDWEAVAIVERLLRQADLLAALTASGWYLRSAPIWAKGLSFCDAYSGSVMPDPCKDRPTNAYENVFLLTKSSRYYYDNEAVKEKGSSGPSDLRKMTEQEGRIGGKHKTLDDPLSKASAATNIGRKRAVGSPASRNLRNVWVIGTEPTSEKHFAAFPKALVRPCILAGTSERGCCPTCGKPWERVVETSDPNGRLGKGFHDDIGDLARGQRGVFSAAGAPTKRTLGWRPGCECYVFGGTDYSDLPVRPCLVLDPFGGTGTTAVVAQALGRDYLLTELNPDYCAMARARLANHEGMTDEEEAATARRIADKAPLLAGLESAEGQKVIGHRS